MPDDDDDDDAAAAVRCHCLFYSYFQLVIRCYQMLAKIGPFTS